MTLTKEALAAIKKRHEACAFESGFRWHHEGAEQVHQDRAALLAHIESTPAPQWRPISEAPEGKVLLMWGPTDVGDDGKIRNWKSATGNWHRGYTDEHSKSEGYTGWWWDGRAIKSYEPQPTRWQLLPEPPK